MKVISDQTLITNPFVSVVIPSYNRKATVSQTIESIINQKCTFEYEIIIGDDYSQDGVRELLITYQRKYPKLIKLLFHDKNIGLGANWATCVKNCNGKYLANCDNDDYWHNPYKLQLQIDFLEKNLQYGVVHTDYRTHNRFTGLVQEVVISDKTLGKPLYKEIFEGRFQFCNATMVYRKALIDRYINLEDFIKYQFTLQDWNTWVILAKYTDFFCMPVSTATFGIETESITRLSNYESVINRFVKEKECYQYICWKFPEELNYREAEYDLYVNRILLNMAYKRGDFEYAKQTAKTMRALGDKSIHAKMAKNIFLFFLLTRMRILFKGNHSVNTK
jgi:glycosyltransferase involved in cell wall biosynthesis